MGLEINMASNGSNNIRVGIDIGTSKVVCLIAEYVDHELRVIGLGSQTSQGLKNGVIVDIESTVSAIESAVNAVSYTHLTLPTNGLV